MNGKLRERSHYFIRFFALGILVTFFGGIMFPAFLASENTRAVFAAGAPKQSYPENLSSADGEDPETMTEEKAEEKAEEETEDFVLRERCDIVIVLDSQTGKTTADCSDGDVSGADISPDIMQLTGTILQEMGYQVYLAENGDIPSNEGKSRDELNADVCVRICYQTDKPDRTDEPDQTDKPDRTDEPDQTDAGSKRLARVLYKEVSEYLQIEMPRYNDGIVPSCTVLLDPATDGITADILSEEGREQIAKRIAAGIDLYFYPKTMYLTFDDGPSAENTEKVLDILKDHNIKATFFLIGENVEKHPEIARRIAEEGHTIGIHCYNHNYKNLYQSVDSYTEDFEKAWQVVYETTGVEAKFFRFPGGSVNAYNKKICKDIIEEMTSRGYVYYDWNASVEDATRSNTPEKSIENARKSVMGRQHVVMLAHDVIQNTALCLEELIEMFPEYQMLPITEDTEPIQF